MIEEEEASVPLDKRPLYWLILIPYEKYVQVYFYSKLQLLEPEFNILELIKEKLKIIQERTNQLVLLNYLQETRICSKYLEAPNSINMDTAFSDEDISDEDNENEDIQDVFNNTDMTETNKFFPGQFSCPLVFTKRFPLHWRLQPNIALKFLSSDVLRLFTVVNRPNMFVIERDDSIVYCKISEESFDNEVEVSPNTTCVSPVHTLSGKNTEDDTQTLIAVNMPETTPKRELSRISSTSPMPHTSSVTRSSSNEKRELVLEVYGIDLPSWVEKEFVNLIEKRLISQITLNEIQQFFSRNSVTKPTLEDVDFILPTSKPSTRREMLRIPDLVNSPYVLLQYFKQSILADNIRPLTGPYVRQSVSNYYNNMFFSQDPNGIQDASKRQLNPQSKTTREIPPGSFCFYYNCTKRAPGSSTPLELMAGQGMAGICLTLLNEYGYPITVVQEEGNYGANFDPEMIHDCLEEDFREAKEGTTFFHIWVDIWVTGTADSEALIQHIYECYRQSLCDYFIEKTVTIDLGAALSLDGALQKAVTDKSEGRLGTILRKKFIESVLFILRKASEFKSPTVYAMEKSIQTTPWCMDDLIRYLDFELRKIDSSLRPTVA
ncbi:uncharacterized protein BX663DRAFT_434036, partial [Cokeromyces recurvatus]|uniref:uncharacterized protein n=1 Tax=Cokeromyces recurvatus TaxID=90255 RepID=UPI002220B35D